MTNREMNRESIRAMFRHMVLIERDKVLTPLAFFIWLCLFGVGFGVYQILIHI